MSTTARELLELFEDVDPDEPIAFHWVSHSEMHEAAQAAGITVTCTQVNRALTIYENMLENKIGVDPYLMFKALGRAAELEKEEERPTETVISSVH